MKIAIDFDGTIVEHAYPDIGKPVPGAIDYITTFQDAGAQLILWTMRSGEKLEEAVNYCRENGIEFVGVNEGIGDRKWTNSPKAYAQLYIDDAAFGCPLIFPEGCRPYVDWGVVGYKVLNMLNFIRR